MSVRPDRLLLLLLSSSAGYPLPEVAWSEMRYTAYSYVAPRM